ncbi:MAG: PAS domain S-box protein [Deltaproteobacteria bacterium]|nr:PAS domain S-box protein [Deltaproteobacteria bacterium]
MENRTEYLKAIFQLLDDGLVWLDHKGTVVLSNPAANKIFGYANNKIEGENLLELLGPGPYNQNLFDFIDRILQEKISGKHNIFSYRKGHSAQELVVQVKYVSLDDRAPKEGWNILLVIRDATQMMEYHRRLLSEKMDGMERVARAVAHSIRNPVTSIGGLASHLLQKGVGGENERQYLQRIVSASKRLEQIVSSVREYTDLSEVKTKPVDLHQTLSSMVNKFHGPAQQKNIKLQYDYGSSPTTGGHILRSDPLLLEKLFNILLNNAIDAMDNGGILGIKLRNTSDGFVVTISDTGKGISPGDMPYLFDPMFTSKADAVGMNMAIALRIVQEHHGTMKVDSTPGEGTSINIDLPADGPHSMWPRPTRISEKQT